MLQPCQGSCVFSANTSIDLLLLLLLLAVSLLHQLKYKPFKVSGAPSFFVIVDPSYG